VTTRDSYQGCIPRCTPAQTKRRTCGPMPFSLCSPSLRHFVTQGLLPSVVVLGCGFSLPVCGFVTTFDLLIDWLGLHEAPAAPQRQQRARPWHRRAPLLMQLLLDAVSQIAERARCARPRLCAPRQSLAFVRQCATRQSWCLCVSVRVQRGVEIVSLYLCDRACASVRALFLCVLWLCCMLLVKQECACVPVIYINCLWLKTVCYVSVSPLFCIRHKNAYHCVSILYN